MEKEWREKGRSFVVFAHARRQPSRANHRAQANRSGEVGRDRSILAAGLTRGDLYATNDLRHNGSRESGGCRPLGRLSPFVLFSSAFSAQRNSMADTDHESELSSGEDKYTVVARRYRPKTFEDLVGQDTVAQALLRAIETHRVGHAYLFTGARGVGKTSTARIFAKALNASQDGSGRFDPKSEIAAAIDNGEDMDVIEIDGASNRGIDEIRQLRANASIRPSRAPFKIYIIDEVHMLTTQAFNALLKTLEEPPGHVKFIFCTTDPEKIPITVLSRCQRFDFPPVATDQILDRLKLICQTEGAQADEDALRLIARRAAGSMRDSQSLLEQLLSFGGHRITVDDVHAMLGTADETRLASFANCMIERDASSALVELDSAVNVGVDPGQLAEQLLGYLRDMMAIAIGGPTELMRTANPNGADELRKSGQEWGTMNLLSALQLLDETIVRMKHSVQSRILLEVALVQICNLQDLQALADVLKGLAAHQVPSASPRPAARPAGQTAARPATQPVAQPATRPAAQSTTAPSIPPASAEPDPKKKDELVDANSPSILVQPETTASSSNYTPPTDTLSADEPAVLNSTAPQSPLEVFRRVIPGLGGSAAQAAIMAVEIRPVSPSHWRVLLAREAKFAIDQFRNAEYSARFHSAIRTAVGHDVTLEWLLTDRPLPPDTSQPESNEEVASASISRSSIPQNQRIREAMGIPIIKQFMDLFQGEILRVDEAPKASTISPPKILSSEDGEATDARQVVLETMD